LTGGVGRPWNGAGKDLRPRSVSAPRFLNVATVLRAGEVLGHHAKRELPNYQVFDEKRYFQSGREAGLPGLVVDVGGWKVGVLICEDAWFDEPGDAAKAQGADALVVLNASPFHAGKRAEREASMASRARQLDLPLLYAHQVGGQDEVVFDGASFAVDARGELAARARSFEVETLMVTLHREGRVTGSVAQPLSFEAEVWAALVCGV